MEDPILQVNNLICRLQIQGNSYVAVDRLSFSLYPGKTLAIVGESGCGKTLTALSLLRILPHPPALPAEGEVLFRGQNLLHISEKEMRTIRGSRIAMIFQSPASALNPVYTIGNQLIEAAELHLGLYGEEAFDKALKTLKDVGISSPLERMDDYPHQMSGGMKQRVMIAMALICEPDILIADEPTTALDVTIQAQVLDLIRELQKRKKMAVLLITHDMGVVAEMADDVIVMYAAEAVERGSVEQIFDKMTHPYTLGLFQSRPALQPAQARLDAIKGSVPSIKNYPHGCKFHPRCPFVMDKCKHGAVPYFPIQSGHASKCWLYEGKTGE
jgi:oligopeptide/dipeptide ABC transporter ATP-binding protein